jgi:uncharacterized protein
MPQGHWASSVPVHASGREFNMGTATNQDGSLDIDVSTDILILLLYAPGKTSKTNEPVKGITRLQKLLFLLQESDMAPADLVKDASQYLFAPYKMGPYTSQLQQDLDELQAAGIVRTRRLEYRFPDDRDDEEIRGLDSDEMEYESKRKRVVSYEYSLTELGIKIGEDYWDDALSPAQRTGLREFKESFNSITLRQLLVYVYEKHPKYAAKSEIKAQLGLA